MTVAQNPLTSLANDVAITARAIPGTTGRCCSWAAPMAAESSPKPARQPCRGRPNAATYTPNQGRSPGEAPQQGPGRWPELRPGTAGFLAITPEGLDPATWARRAAAVPGLPQLPLAAGATLGKVTVAAWQPKSSRHIIADDRTVNPNMQRAVA